MAKLRERKLNEKERTKTDCEHQRKTRELRELSDCWRNDNLKTLGKTRNRSRVSSETAVIEVKRQKREKQATVTFSGIEEVKNEIPSTSKCNNHSEKKSPSAALHGPSQTFSKRQQIPQSISKSLKKQVTPVSDVLLDAKSSDSYCSNLQSQKSRLGEISVGKEGKVVIDIEDLRPCKSPDSKCGESCSDSCKNKTVKLCKSTCSKSCVKLEQCQLPESSTHDSPDSKSLDAKGEIIKANTSKDTAAKDVKAIQEDHDYNEVLTPKQISDFIQVHRKKLRSEISKEQLWEGFPVDIKLPRLKNKPDRSSNSQNKNDRHKRSKSEPVSKVVETDVNKNRRLDYCDNTDTRNVKCQEVAKVTTEDDDQNMNSSNKNICNKATKRSSLPYVEKDKNIFEDLAQLQTMSKSDLAQHTKGNNSVTDRPNNEKTKDEVSKELAETIDLEHENLKLNAKSIISPSPVGEVSKSSNLSQLSNCEIEKEMIEINQRKVSSPVMAKDSDAKTFQYLSHLEESQGTEPDTELENYFNDLADSLVSNGSCKDLAISHSNKHKGDSFHGSNKSEVLCDSKIKNVSPSSLKPIIKTERNLAFKADNEIKADDALVRASGKISDCSTTAFKASSISTQLSDNSFTRNQCNVNGTSNTALGENELDQKLKAGYNSGTVVKVDKEDVAAKTDSAKSFMKHVRSFELQGKIICIKECKDLKTTAWNTRVKVADCQYVKSRRKLIGGDEDFTNLKKHSFKKVKIEQLSCGKDSDAAGEHNVSTPKTLNHSKLKKLKEQNDQTAIASTSIDHELRGLSSGVLNKSKNSCNIGPITVDTENFDDEDNIPLSSLKAVLNSQNDKEFTCKDQGVLSKKPDSNHTGSRFEDNITKDIADDSSSKQSKDGAKSGKSYESKQNPTEVLLTNSKCEINNNNIDKPKNKASLSGSTNKNIFENLESSIFLKPFHKTTAQKSGVENGTSSEKEAKIHGLNESKRNVDRQDVKQKEISPAKKKLNDSGSSGIEGRVLTRLKTKTPEKFGLKKIGEEMFKSLPEPVPRKRKSVISELKLFDDMHLAKSACSLWFNEVKRHFQQEHPSATNSELSGVMRRAWEQMPAKQKLVYFIRAKAVNEGKLGGFKKHVRQESIKQPPVRRNLAVEEFKLLHQSQQDSIISEKLSVIERDLSPTQYSAFINDFHKRYKTAQVQNINGAPSQPKKRCRPVHNYVDARLLMYALVVQTEKILPDLKRERLAHHKKVFRQSYISLLEKLIQSPADGKLSNCSLVEREENNDVVGGNECQQATVNSNSAQSIPNDNNVKSTAVSDSANEISPTKLGSLTTSNCSKISDEFYFLNEQSPRLNRTLSFLTDFDVQEKQKTEAAKLKEKDNDVEIIEDPSNSPRFEKILHSLENGSVTGNLNFVMGGEKVIVPDVANYSNYRCCLMSALNSDLPQLDVNEISEYLSGLS